MFTREQWAKPEMLEPREHLPEGPPFLRVWYEPFGECHYCWCLWQWNEQYFVRQARAAVQGKDEMLPVSIAGGMREIAASIWVRDLVVKAARLPALARWPEKPALPEKPKSIVIDGIRRGYQCIEEGPTDAPVFWNSAHLPVDHPLESAHRALVKDLIAAFGGAM